MMFQTLVRMLAKGGTLKLRCDACGHAAAWGRERALRRLGPDATPYEIRRRLVCSACRRADALSVWV